MIKFTTQELEMENYQKMKKSIEMHQNTLNKAKDKTDNLKNSTKEIRNMWIGYNKLDRKNKDMVK